MIDLRSRRARARALRWREPLIGADEALELVEAMAARHGGDPWAVVGELIAILLKRGDLTAS